MDAAAAAALDHGSAPYYEVASATSASEGIPLMPDPRPCSGAVACLVACGANGGGVAVERGWAGGGGGGGGNGGGGVGSGGGSGGDGGERAAAKLELLRQCQRQVDGSLDDVVGLE